MDVKAHHRMLITTAVIAAMVAVMATPAQAYFADVEGGGSEISATAVAVATVMGGGPPDAIDRYAANHQTTTLTLGGSPDAIDRYLANQQAATLTLGGSSSATDRYLANQHWGMLALNGSPDAIDRYRANQHWGMVALGSPDAIDRYVANQQATTSALGGSPDAIDRYLGKGTLVAAEGASSDSWFDRTWLGLGAGFSALLAVGMAGVFFSARHRGRVALP